MSDPYLFIDGGYLRQRYAEGIRKFFGEEGKLDFQEIRDDIQPRRAFYYDCLNDVRDADEPERAYDKRVADQKAVFSKVRSTRGFHVRLGSLRGEKKKKRRQKEVDVSLAVDMLTHSFSRNTSDMVLIAGDLDFKPLVEAVVRLGTWVTLMAARQSAARELIEAADHWEAIDLDRLHRWSSKDFRDQHSMPQVNIAREVNHSWRLRREGHCEGSEVALYEEHNTLFLRWKERAVCGHFREDQLEFYFRQKYGKEIVWNDKNT